MTDDPVRRMIDKLTAEFRASSDHAIIAKNRALLKAAVAEANATLSMVQTLSETNHSLCDHKDARGYTDRSGVGCLDCPHCGGD